MVPLGGGGKVTSRALAGRGAANHSEAAIAATRTIGTAIFDMLLYQFDPLIIPAFSFLRSGSAPSLFFILSERSNCSVFRFLNIMAISDGILPANMSISSLSVRRVSANFSITASLGGGITPLSILLR